MWRAMDKSKRCKFAQLVVSPAFYLPYLLNAGRQRIGEVLGIGRGGGQAMPIPEISLLLLGFVSILVLAKDRRTFPRPSPVVVCSVVIWMWFAVSLFWSEGLEWGLVKVMLLSVAVAEVMVALWVLRDSQDLLYFAVGQVCFASVMALASVLQWDGGRLSALGGGSNVFGRFMFSGIVSALYLLRQLGGELSLVKRLGLRTVAGLFALLMLLTGSRGVLVSAAATAGMVTGIGWFSHDRSLRRAWAAWTGYTLALGAVVVTVLPWVPDIVADRYYAFFVEGDIGSTGVKRLAMFDTAMDLFRSSPLWGIGAGGYTAVTGNPYPHNWFMELLSEGGLVAFVAGSILVILALAASIRLVKSASIASRLLVPLFVFTLVAGQFSGDLFDNRLVLVYGSVVSVLARRSVSPANSTKRIE